MTGTSPKRKWFWRTPLVPSLPQAGRKSAVRRKGEMRLRHGDKLTFK